MKTTMNMKALMSAGCLVFAVLSAAAEPWGRAYVNGSSSPVQELDTWSATGGAVLTNGQLVAGVNEIRLAGGEIKVDHLDLADLTITIAGHESGTTLKPDTGRLPPEYGGALHAIGGSVTITNVVFDCFAAESAGGAVMLQEMTGDCAIANCSFANCMASLDAGVGGAVYASAKTGRNAKLYVRASTFVDCRAVNGGAITTERIYPYKEKAIALDIDGGAFVGNDASYMGGALWIEGDATFAHTLFENNFAWVDGGAVCAGSSDVPYAGATVRSLAGTVFRDNAVHADEKLLDEGYAGNGGAIALSSGDIKLYAERTAFEGNQADYSGGAIFAGFPYGYTGAGNKVCLTTCVFSNNVLTLDEAFGGAVSVEHGSCAMTNVTVRGSNHNALDFFGTDAGIVNCVVIGNGDCDIRGWLGEGAPTLTVYRSAYGSLKAEDSLAVSTEECLAGRTTDDYDGSSLYLRGGEPYNPVAAEGLIQDATDFDNVSYGSKDYGYSMGAFECGTASCISGKSFVLLYDGKGHTNEFSSSSTLVPVSWSYATTKVGPFLDTMPAFTNVGTYTTYAVADMDGFSQVTNMQTVVITNRYIELESAGASKTYDGDPLTTNDVWVVGTGDNGLADGDCLVFACTGSQTPVGSSDNTFVSSITNALGKTVTGNYVVAKTYGTLKVFSAEPPNPDRGPGPEGPFNPGPFPGPNVPPEVALPSPTNGTDHVDLSDYDYIGVYDGIGHTMDTNVLWIVMKDDKTGPSTNKAWKGVVDTAVVEFSADGVNWTTELDAFTYTDVVATSFWYRVCADNFKTNVHAVGVTITQRVVHVEFPTVTKVYDGNDSCPAPGYVETNLTKVAENMVEHEEIDAVGRGHFADPNAGTPDFILTNVTLTAGEGTKLSNYRVFVGANGGLEFPTDGVGAGPTTYDPEDPRWPGEGGPKVPGEITDAGLPPPGPKDRPDDPTEPKPTGYVGTPFDWYGCYDGEGHTILDFKFPDDSGITDFTVLYSATEGTGYDTELVKFQDVTNKAPVYVKIVAPNYEPLFTNAYVTITQRVVHIEMPTATKVYDGTVDYDGTVATNAVHGTHNVVEGEEIVAEGRGRFDSPNTDASAFILTELTLTAGEGTKLSNYRVFVGANGGLEFPTDGEGTGPTTYDQTDPRWPDDPDHPGRPAEPKGPGEIDGTPFRTRNDVYLSGGHPTPERIEKYMDGVAPGTVVAFRLELWTNDVPRVTTVGTNIIVRFRGYTAEDTASAVFRWSTKGENGPWSAVAPRFRGICATQVWCQVSSPNHMTTNVTACIYIKSRESKTDDEDAEEEDKLRPNPLTESQTGVVMETIAKNDNRDPDYKSKNPGWDGKGDGEHGAQTDGRVNLKVTSIANLPAAERAKAEAHLAAEIARARKESGVKPESVKGRNIDVKLMYTQTYADGQKVTTDIGERNTVLIPFTIGVKLEEGERIIRVVRYHGDERIEIPVGTGATSEHYELSKDRTSLTIWAMKYSEFIIVTGMTSCDCDLCCPFGYRLKVMVRTTAGCNVKKSSECGECGSVNYRGPVVRRFMGMVYGATKSEGGRCGETGCACNDWTCAWVALYDYDNVAAVELDESDTGFAQINRIGCGKPDGKVETAFTLGFLCNGAAAGWMNFAGFGLCGNHDGKITLGVVSGYCAGLLPAAAVEVKSCEEVATCGNLVWNLCCDTAYSCRTTAAYGKWTLVWDGSIAGKVGTALPLNGGKVEVSEDWGEATAVDIGLEK